MSDYSSPFFSEGSVRPTQQEGLSPEQIEATLDQFRAWLEDACHTPKDQESFGEESEAESGVPPDLHTLLGQFVALRHEIKLQTKNGRALMDQSSESLQHLGKALDALEKSQATIAGQSDALSSGINRELLKALLTVHDALTLADREVQRVQNTLLPVLDELVKDAGELLQLREWKKQTFWERLFSRKRPEPDSNTDGLPAIARMASTRVKQFVTSVVTGYSMSVQRLERALAENNLQPIPTLGENFDPELMEAIEVIVELGRESTEVIEEVRRGYRLNGRVFRPAQVRVAKPVVNGIEK